MRPPRRWKREDWQMPEQTNGEVSKEAVLAALRQIQDPDLHRDIVTLGFVPDGDVNICGENVSVKITLTTPPCPASPMPKSRWTLRCARQASAVGPRRSRACATSSPSPPTRGVSASPPL